MKKIFLVLLLLLMISQNVAFCAPTNSENAFEILIEEVPPGGGKKSGGLSSGAVTAIALGSVFGGLAAIGGLTYYFLKCGMPLKAGCVLGACAPLTPVQSVISVKEMQIENKTFNTVYIELPKFDTDKTINIKLTQTSKPYGIRGKLPELDTRLFENGSDTKEYPMSVSKMDFQNGVLVKNGQITVSKNKTATLVTSYDSSSKSALYQKYNLLLEFEVK